ncbi:hypothetical protein V1517DRAFT_265548 [Lipomyces orientalis]|uniref:Uncharacterized protein n=1 Tax=Lipomyces orientalis TaxID=1233043 RepID=A0ACC3TF75_9ASCO
MIGRYSDNYVTNLFQVNLFGQMHLTQVILPFFHAPGYGTIAFTSSGSGWMAMPLMSHYAMTKAVLSTFAESLHKEVSPLGIRAVAFDLESYPTRLMEPRDAASEHNTIATSDASKPLLGELVGMFSTDPLGLMPGDPAKCASTIFDVVKGEGVVTGRKWADRVVLGSDCLGYAKVRREEELKLLDIWEDVTISTDGRTEVCSSERHSEVHRPRGSGDFFFFYFF